GDVEGPAAARVAAGEPLCHSDERPEQAAVTREVEVDLRAPARAHRSKRQREVHLGAIELIDLLRHLATDLALADADNPAFSAAVEADVTRRHPDDVHVEPVRSFNIQVAP